jgi:hypothetical protein
MARGVSPIQIARHLISWKGDAHQAIMNLSKLYIGKAEDAVASEKYFGHKADVVDERIADAVKQALICERVAYYLQKYGTDCLFASDVSRLGLLPEPSNVADLF